MTTDIDLMDHRINRLGSALPFHPVSLETAAAAGVDDAIVLYAGGRAGAMGDVTAAQVQSAFGFFSPSVIELIWPTVIAAGTPTHINEVYLDALAAAARESWPEDAATTVTTIGREVIDVAPLFGTALFSAWRGLPLPPDAHGSAGIVIEVLRELRGDVNLQSVAVSGMSPLEADLATSGEDRVKLHGWAPPYPEVGHLAGAVAAAEAQTSQRMQQIYALVDTGKVAALSEAVAVLAEVSGAT